MLVRGEAVVGPIDDLRRMLEAGSAELAGECGNVLSLSQGWVILGRVFSESVDEVEGLRSKLAESSHDEGHELGLALLGDVCILASLLGLRLGNRFVGFKEPSWRALVYDLDIDQIHFQPQMNLEVNAPRVTIAQAIQLVVRRGRGEFDCEAMKDFGDCVMSADDWLLGAAFARELVRAVGRNGTLAERAVRGHAGKGIEASCEFESGAGLLVAHGEVRVIEAGRFPVGSVWRGCSFEERAQGRRDCCDRVFGRLVNKQLSECVL